MTTQPEALRLADSLEELYARTLTATRAAAELRRLHQHELASRNWLDKTNWVQETAQDGELGMHRVDVLKKRIDALNESNTELLEALRVAKAGEKLCEKVLKARAAIAKGEQK